MLTKTRQDLTGKLEVVEKCSKEKQEVNRYPLNQLKSAWVGWHMCIGLFACFFHCFPMLKESRVVYTNI